jgi:DNA invertase Pin-like site-specific DNA recombinase
MTKAFSYIRFSTPEQSKGNSLDRQAALAADYVAKNNLELDSTLTFRDLGVSAFTGKNSETGALAAFKTAVENELVEAGSYLLVESLDRISRQTARKAVRILEDICDLDITVVTLNDGKAYTAESLSADPISFLMSFLVFMRSNEESATKSKRLSAAWSNKRDNISVKPLTARVPEWLTVKDNKIEIIPDRAEIVERIFAEYLEGTGAESIAKSLNASGVDTWGRGKQKGKVWGKSYVNRILTTPAVYGEYTAHTLEMVESKKVRNPQKTIENYFPVVIDKQTFARAQALREGKVFAGRKQTVELKNIFSSIACCKLCGSVMIRTQKGHHAYLVCSSAKRGNCKYETIRYDKVSEKFINVIRGAIDHMPNVDKRHNEFLREIRLLRKQQTSMVQRLNNLTNALEESDTTGTTAKSIVERIVSLEGQKDELEQRIKAKASEIKTLEPTNVLLQRKSLVAVLERAELDISRCNALLGELCTSIVFTDLDRIEVYFKNGAVLDLDFVGGKPFTYRAVESM